MATRLVAGLLYRQHTFAASDSQGGSMAALVKVEWTWFYFDHSMTAARIKSAITAQE